MRDLTNTYWRYSDTGSYKVIDKHKPEDDQSKLVEYWNIEEYGDIGKVHYNEIIIDDQISEAEYKLEMIK